METITIKLEDKFAKDVDDAIKKHRYTTKTEFVREAIRDKLRDIEREEALVHAKKLYGTSKRKTTDKMLHKAREKAFGELE